MADYKYTKAVGQCNSDILADEIFANLAKKVKKDIPADSVDGYLHFVDDGSTDNLHIHLDVALSGADETTLGTTVSNHTS